MHCRIVTALKLLINCYCCIQLSVYITIFFNISSGAFLQQSVATDLKEVRLLVKPEYLQNGERNSCQTGLILLVHITNYGNTIKTVYNQIKLLHTETANSTRNKEQQRHSVLINIQPYPIVSDKIAAYRFRE